MGNSWYMTHTKQHQQ